MTLARKGLLKSPGSPSPGVQGQRPIFKPSQRRPQCALGHPLSAPCSLPQPSLSIDLKGAPANGLCRREDGRKQHSGFSGRRDDSFQRAGVQQMAFWLKLSADSAPQGKGIASQESGLFCTPPFASSLLLSPRYVLARASVYFIGFTTFTFQRRKGKPPGWARLGPSLPPTAHPFFRAVPCDHWDLALVKGDKSCMGLHPPQKHPPSVHTIWHAISEASCTHMTSNLRPSTSSEKSLVQVTFGQVHNLNQCCWLSEATWCVSACQRVISRGKGKAGIWQGFPPPKAG